MRAVLLAAGLGLRMRPLTAELPKPVLPVLGRPMLLQILERLQRFGVRQAVVNLHHLPEIVRRTLARAPAGLEVLTSPEPEILGTAGGLRQAADLLRGAGPILIHNCDCLSDIDFSAMLDRHRRSGLSATLALTQPRPEYAVVETDGADRVLSLAGRPEVDPGVAQGRFLFTGCHIVEAPLLERIPVGRPAHIVTDVYQPLAASGGLGSYRHSGFWWEFGSPEAYLEGSLRLLDLSDDSLGEIAAVDPRHRMAAAITTVGAGASLHSSAVFRGRVAIGAGAVVAGGCVIEDSLILPGARLGGGTRLTRAIVGGGVELPRGYRGESVMVARDGFPDETLPAEIRRENGLQVRPLAPRGG